jgi:hypothetical protein
MTNGRLEAQARPAEVEEDFVYRYWLRVGQRELPLEDGETLIGRGDECHVGICEGMVSRRHARVVVGQGRPFIEDLGSANGTFLNQAKVEGRAELYPGDRVFIGTCEIELIRRMDDEDRPTVPVLDPRVRATPPSGVVQDAAMTGRPTARERPAVTGIERRSDAPPSSRDPRTELEQFEAVAHLADKTLTMGRVDAALRILAGPLEETLARARRGRPPGDAVLDAMGRYAVKLANETLDGRWLNLAIEMHLLASRPFQEETIQQLATLRARTPIGSDELIGRYYEALRANMASFSAADRVLCERVACLLPALGVTP